MIAQLTGLVTRTEANSVILDVGGVGYQVFVPVTVLSALPEPGGKFTLATHLIVQRAQIERLLLEGGATASAVLRRIGATRLRVCGQFSKGIAAFQIPGRDTPILAIKPGSYPWPEAVWPS